MQPTFGWTNKKADASEKMVSGLSGPQPSSESRDPGMSTLTGSVFGWVSEQTEDQMGIDRRSFLTAGLAIAGLAVLPGKYPVADFISADDLAAIFGLHPFPVSLLERVAGARSAVDRSKVEQFIRQRAEYIGHRLPPVIKWLPGPQAAFDHLSRHGLTNLLQMENAAFWRQSGCPEMDEEILDRWCAISRLANDLLRPDEHDRALMAPKLVAEQAPPADPGAAFEVRVFAAQIGWLETSIPDATVEALCRVEVLLSQGLSEASEPVHHQLEIIQAYQHGLLATGETPAELICVLRPPAKSRAGSGRLCETRCLPSPSGRMPSPVHLTRATDFSRRKSPRHGISSVTSW